MSDLERLQNKLSKLSAGQIGAGLDSATEAGFLSGLVELIDETVLPRRLTLRSENAQVVLTINKRRLIAVEGDVAENFAEDDVSGALARLKVELLRAFMGDGPLELAATRAEIAPDLQASGASSEALGAAWGANLGGPGAGSDRPFTEVLRSKAHAWVQWNQGAIEDEGGDPKYLAAVKSVAIQPIREEFTRDKGFVAAAGIPTQTAIGFAWDGDCSAVFILARSDLALLEASFSSA